MESLKTILYFSIFRYPLTLEEIHSYTNHNDIAETENELTNLESEEIIKKIDDFYVYNKDLDSVPKRLKGNLEAQKAMLIAKKRANFIAKFPYVKAVGISGSLSKSYYDKNSDIDFFIITDSNKLWICRTILILFKKIFLLNSKKYFCVNYFISTSQLEIEEQNRFTATELKTLIPMHGKEVFEEFYKANDWVAAYFSKFISDLSQVTNTQKPFLTKSIEFIFNSNIGQFFDNLFKLITLKKWKSKFKFLNQDDFKIALKSTQNISKHHPSNFQKKVILALNSKIEEVRNNFNIILQKENV
ncbi:nucleotidyltransferase domain-containing protein [Flavobacterium urocaniciphilum]|uniref:Nucleotidyltransferase domain-containing protein n=1 Tax=Flavobacterium urocaniciphilum TaxID=1299341 RepID=A0A1H9DGR8_9FLAO|nr:nucleotidyltransferase domain-containing protein [Flavobacterium urocaniciphilum]SEQ12581.1 Nucleotidyltransferase domain-containing protein [Flavobacterium urocaniciphilum]